MIKDELIIVGSRYGDLADVLNPLYETEEPIEPDHIKEVIGSDVVCLQPVCNHEDPYAVGVFLNEEKRLGFVWKEHSYPLHEWMVSQHIRLYKALIKRINTHYGFMVADIELPFKLTDSVRKNSEVEPDWAATIPVTMTSDTQQGLSLGVALICDELTEAKEWSESLRKRFENLQRYLPSDLSAHHIKESLELYEQMKHSPIKEVRKSCDDILEAFVHRGSAKQMKWWAHKWLPSFFHETAKNDLLGLFETANYSLERVENLLKSAPANLFYLYKFDRVRFATHLYYAALPQDIYNRLLTLLAVREAMLAKMKKRSDACLATFDDLPASRQEIIRRIETLTDKGDWMEPATADGIKAMMRTALGVGSQPLTSEEKRLSKILWELFESGQGDRVRITFQNLIGYWAFYQYLPSNKKSAALNKMFFGLKATVYQNIDKGKPGSKDMPPRFREIVSLLDRCRPQYSEKTT